MLNPANTYVCEAQIDGRICMLLIDSACAGLAWIVDFLGMLNPANTYVCEVQIDGRIGMVLFDSACAGLAWIVIFLEC